MSNETETAVAVVDRQTAVVPFADMERMAHAIARSGLFGMKTPEQALTLMFIAQAEGQHPATIARDYDIIQGRPAKKSEAMLRSFLAGGGTVEWHHLDDTKAEATFNHPQGGRLKITWDMARAQRAGLADKPTWKQYPRQMLRSRCVSEGVRTVWPIASSGLYVPEEVHDFQQERNVTPTVRQRMESATTVDELNEAAKAASNLPEAEKKALRELYKVRFALLGPAVEPEHEPATAPPPEPETGKTEGKPETNGKRRPKALEKVAQHTAPAAPVPDAPAPTLAELMAKLEAATDIIALRRADVAIKALIDSMPNPKDFESEKALALDVFEYRLGQLQRAAQPAQGAMADII